jgi:ubiquinone/menaquinone biosynthesis C-methylase UbiE
MMLAWGAPLVVVLGLAFLGLVRCRMPRDMNKERPGDYRAALAYDRVSRWPLFSFIRYVFIHRLRRYEPRGLLLDAGCGPGYLAVKIAEEFPWLDVMGVDVSEDALGIAAGHAGSLVPDRSLRFLEADINRLPLEDSSVDFVVSTLSLHHWPEPELSFREMYRVLRSQGQLLVFDLRRDMPWLLFWFIRFGQRYVAPPPIRRTNGGVGSVWSSLTPWEIDAVLSASPFREWSVRKEWGWVTIWAKKQ